MRQSSVQQLLRTQPASFSTAVGLTQLHCHWGVCPQQARDWARRQARWCPRSPRINQVQLCELPTAQGREFGVFWQFARKKRREVDRPTGVPARRSQESHGEGCGSS